MYGSIDGRLGMLHLFEYLMLSLVRISDVTCSTLFIEELSLVRICSTFCFMVICFLTVTKLLMKYFLIAVCYFMVVTVYY